MQLADWRHAGSSLTVPLTSCTIAAFMDSCVCMCMMIEFTDGGTWCTASFKLPSLRDRAPRSPIAISV